MNQIGTPLSLPSPRKAGRGWPEAGRGAVHGERTALDAGRAFHTPFALSANPPHPALSPSEGERVPEGRVRGRFMVPMPAKNERGHSTMRPVRALGFGCETA